MMAKKIALLGSPNSGKTNLYNWLTGSKFKTVNYPGSTVEYATGRVLPELGGGFDVVDTPGVYGLEPRSADEVLSIRTIFEKEFGVDAVMVVVDGTQLERHLLLARQVNESGLPMMIVITMNDLLEKRKINIDVALISKFFTGVPVVLFDGVLGKGLKEVVSACASLQAPTSGAVIAKPLAWTVDKKMSEIGSIHKLLDEVMGRSAREEIQNVSKLTVKLDQWILHPVFGFMIFLSVMTALFSSIYWLAAPFTDFVDQGFSMAGEFAGDKLSGHPLLASLFSEGIIGSLGSVLVFVPQIFILFFLIGFLESTGFLARAATMIDKPFSKIGLSGRSFVPFLSGYSCAVPAIIAVRNISSFREKLISALVIPLLTCSARLPVYALLLGFLFVGEPSWKAGLALSGLYLGAMLLSAIAAAILNRMIPQEKGSYFMMELPLYRMPRLKVIFNQTISRTISYVKKAGPIIFVVGVLMWTGTKFPLNEQGEIQENISGSYVGHLGQVVNPVFEPMGVDWRVGVGLMSAFLAREVFVSTLAVIMNVSNEDEDSQQQSLITSMQEATFPDGRKIFTVSSVLGLLLFFMIALQCVSTFAIFLKEMGSPKIAYAQLIGLNLIAYVLAVALVQGLRLFGVA